MLHSKLQLVRRATLIGHCPPAARTRQRAVRCRNRVPNPHADKEREMVARCSQSCNWFHGMTLAERIASRRAAAHTPVTIPIDTALAQRRLQQWRSQEPFTDDSLFRERLAVDGIDES